MVINFRIKCLTSSFVSVIVYFVSKTQNNLLILSITDTGVENTIASNIPIASIYSKRQTRCYQYKKLTLQSEKWYQKIRCPSTQFKVVLGFPCSGFERNSLKGPSACDILRSTAMPLRMSNCGCCE